MLYQMRRTLVLISISISALPIAAQQPQPEPAAKEPPAISLQEALDRAKKYGLEIQSANIAALLAREDRIQAKAAMLPAAQSFNQYIYTQGNGTPPGIFVSNDGVHVYNIQAQLHEDLSLTRRAEYRRTIAAEVVAQAKADITARGIAATVVQDYYAMVIAQRRLSNARQSLQDAQKFLDITQKQEHGGEAAHADVVKAEVQAQQRERDVSDAQLNIEKSRLALAVIIFPDFRQDFNVADDLNQIAPLAPFREVQDLATAKSPELRAAQASLQEGNAEVSVARSAYLPALSFDYFYGINANEIAIYDHEHRRNLGSVAQGTMTIPLWNWGSLQSKVKQAQLKQQQAQLELSYAQRQLMANLNALYREAELARSQLDSLRKSMDLSAESVRLTVLRYEAGEAAALEVVDAQTTLAQARNAYDDGLSRYRVALANLQTLTGNL